MIQYDANSVIRSPEQLRSCYGEPSPRSLVKEIDHLSDEYRQFVEAAPFAIVASVAAEGVDISPRGDAPGFVGVHDEKTLLLPDRNGNNRADTLMNIVRDPRLSMLFMIPGVGETLRVIGTGTIVTDEALCASFAVNGKNPRSVLVIDIEKVYFQCQKALARSRLWAAESQVAPGTLPTAGQMLKAFDAQFDAVTYDANYPEHMAKTIY